MNEWHIEKWVSDSEKDKIEYSQYWNNETIEKNKAWYVVDGNFSGMESYLKKTGLPQDLNRCIQILRSKFKRPLSGVGIDLAAGNLWAASYLLNLGNLEKLYCLEYSWHRLFKLGPIVLEHYNVPREKVILVLGSFYDLHLNDNSLDFVFMSSAFHHAERPEQLLTEIRRVLKTKGVLIVLGEHVVNYYRHMAKYFLKYIISMLLTEKYQTKLFNKTIEIKGLSLEKKQLLRPDPGSGDHYYTSREYAIMFSKYGFKVEHFKNRHSQFQSFVLVVK